VHIRPAARSDVDAIEAVLAECGSSWAGRHVAAELVRDCAVVLVASTDAADAPAGGAQAGADAGVLGCAVAWRVAGDSHILELGVRGSARRRGLGSSLLEAAVKATRERGGAALLEVREGNRDARRLYSRLGFEEVGRRKGYYRDGEAAVLCTRRASPAEADTN